MTVTLSDLHLERTLRLNVKDEFEECKAGGKETSQGTDSSQCHEKRGVPNPAMRKNRGQGPNRPD